MPMSPTELAEYEAAKQRLIGRAGTFFWVGFGVAATVQIVCTWAGLLPV